MRVGGWLLLVLALGCAGTAQQDAIALAKAGSGLADSAQANLSGIRNSLDHYVEGQYLEAGLTQKPEPSADQLASVQTVRLAIALRERALGELSALYASLGRLGEYDAAADAEANANGLTDSINQLGTVVGSAKPPLSHVTAGFIDKGAGLLAGEMEAHAIRSASSEIRTRLEQFRSHLEREKEVYDSLRTTMVKAQVRIARTLYAKGMGDSAPVLMDLLHYYGFGATQKDASAALTRLGEPARDAIGNIIAYRAGADARREGSILDATIDGLGALIAEHRQLEAGGALSLETVQRQTLLLQALLADYEEWHKLDRQSAAQPAQP